MSELHSRLQTHHLVVNLLRCVLVCVPDCVSFFWVSVKSHPFGPEFDSEYVSRYSSLMFSFRSARCRFVSQRKSLRHLCSDRANMSSAEPSWAHLAPYLVAGSSAHATIISPLVLVCSLSVCHLQEKADKDLILKLLLSLHDHLAHIAGKHHTPLLYTLFFI